MVTDLIAEFIYFVLMLRSNFYYIISFLSISTFTISHLFTQSTSSKYLLCAKPHVTKRYKDMDNRPGDVAQEDCLPSMYKIHTKSHFHTKVSSNETLLFFP